MVRYIGTKLIEAIPAQKDGEDGYKVVYPDGYISWSPADVFERAYLPLSINTRLNTDKPSIGREMVDDFIAHTEVQTLGDKTTVVRAVLRNGFELVESSSWGCGQNLGPYGYPADKFGVRIPLDCLYSRGLIPPRESLIRFSQYQCRY